MLLTGLHFASESTVPNVPRISSCSSITRTANCSALGVTERNNCSVFIIPGRLEATRW